MPCIHEVPLLCGNSATKITRTSECAVQDLVIRPDQPQQHRRALQQVTQQVRIADQQESAGSGIY